MIQSETQKVEKSDPKNHSEIIEALREEATKNRTLNDICHIFAVRERARTQVTVGSLRQTMYKEGFSHTTAEYEKALRILSGLGIGKLHYDRSGKVHALKDIKLTLKSIGLAAVSKSKEDEPELKTVTKQNKFVNLPSVVSPKQTATLKKSVGDMEEDQQQKYSASLMVVIDGKSVTFPLPHRISTQDLGEILTQGSIKK